MLGNINLSLARRTMLRQLGWAADYDGATENLQITNPKNVYSGEYSLKADFSGDAVGQVPAGLIQGTGQYLVKNNDPSPFSNSGKYTECTVAGTAAFPCNQSTGKWEFDVYKGNNANVLTARFINANADGAGVGYGINLTSAQAIDLYKLNPAGLRMYITANSYILNNVWYRIKIERLTNGQFSVWIKGGAFGNEFILVSTVGGSGTNPFTDNTFMSSNFFALDLDQGDRIANISCEYGTGSFDLSGFERILHSGNRDFETPVAFGPELITNGGAPGQTDWIDSNVDGLADGWGFYVAPDAVSTIVTGNGFTGNAQRIANNSGVNKDVLSINNLTAGKCYRISLKFRSSHNLLVNSGDYAWGTPVNLGVNTGNAKYAEFDAFVNRTTLTFRNNTAGGWYEIDEVSAKELKSDWTEKGNHICYITGLEKKTGNYGLAMVSSGPGDAVNNCIELPASKFRVLKSGDKYTVDGPWARGTGILGSNLFPNGAEWIDSNSDGVADGNINHYTGSNTFSIVTGNGFTGNAQRMQVTTLSVAYKSIMSPGNILCGGKTYKITGKYRSSHAFSIGSTAYIRVSESFPANTGNAAAFTALCAFDNTATTIQFNVNSGDVGAFLEVDDIVIQEITKPTITVLIGGKTKVTTGISCIPGAFTKLVHNFECTEAEVNQPIKIYCNQADTVYLDDIGVSQGFDIAILSWVKPNLLTDGGGIIRTLANGNGFNLCMYSTSGATGWQIKENGEIPTLGHGGIVLTDSFVLVSFTFNHQSSESIFCHNDNISSAVYTRDAGKVLSLGNPCVIGYDVWNASNGYFNGTIGELQFIRFNNIGRSNFEQKKYFKTTIPRRYTGGGALVTLHLKFKGPDDQTFLKDYSPLGQLVTGVNVTKAGDQVRGAYPYYSR